MLYRVWYAFVCAVHPWRLGNLPLLTSLRHGLAQWRTCHPLHARTLWIIRWHGASAGHAYFEEHLEELS